MDFDLLALVRSVFETLRDVTCETVTYSILMGDQTVVIDQVVSANVTSTRFELGASAPLHAGASGRVILAYLDPERYKKLLRFPRLQRLTERTKIGRASCRERV